MAEESLDKEIWTAVLKSFAEVTDKIHHDMNDRARIRILEGTINELVKDHPELAEVMKRVDIEYDGGYESFVHDLMLDLKKLGSAHDKRIPGIQDRGQYRETLHKKKKLANWINKYTEAANLLLTYAGYST